ncbi:MAG: SPOR domain-containing protein [Bacteroidota bacterium]
MKKLLTFLALTSFAAAFSQITITGNFPSSIGSGSSVDADVKINKGTVGNFAKYQMDVPAGITISAIEVKGGNFTFENQRAKIVWVSVPSDPEFTIKLKVMAGSDAPASVTFAQKFYYLENNEKKEVEASPVVISIGGGSGVASTPVTSTPAETKPVETVASTPVETKPAETTPVATSTPVETVASTPVETKPVETVASTPVETKPVETKPVESAPVKKTTAATSEAGMTFKVQIGAFSSQPSKSRYAGLPNLSIDMINGMYKVTTGKFTSKEEAVKFRDELQSKGYSGFIAKYKDGVRVN